MYCEGAIRYQFSKFMDFVITTKQSLRDSTIQELHYSINKGIFVKNASLGKVKKPLKRIFDRLGKHFCSESNLKEYCWEEVTVMNVGECDLVGDVCEDYPGSRTVG